VAILPSDQKQIYGDWTPYSAQNGSKVTDKNRHIESINEALITDSGGALR
jgi:hypothetical protein